MVEGVESEIASVARSQESQKNRSKVTFAEDINKSDDGLQNTQDKFVS